MSQTAFETLDLSEEIEFASKLAREAATIVNTFYVGSSEVRYKSENEPVTEADRSANQHIVTRIQAAYPDDGILSEESKDNLIRLERDRVWIIDPLDGTKEFIARNGEFSIMIGLAIHGKAVRACSTLAPSITVHFCTKRASRSPLRSAIRAVSIR